MTPEDTLIKKAKLSSFLARHEQDQRRQIDAAIDSLIADERFALFMLEVASLREMSLDSLSEVEIIKSERATLCAISEASAFKKIIDIYADKRAQLMAKREAEAAQREVETD